MTTVFVVSPHAKLQIKTEAASPHTRTSPQVRTSPQGVVRTPTAQRPLRPINSAGEPGKARRQLAMNLNKGGPVINNRRNARERNRVKQVNAGFAVLRGVLPNTHKKQKISKVDTLRGAIDYIQGLTELLQSTPPPPPTCEPSAYYQPELKYRPDLVPAGYQPVVSGAGYLPEPPTYQESVRELRQHRQLLGEAPLRETQLEGCSPADDLVNALRWWHAPSPVSQP